MFKHLLHQAQTALPSSCNVCHSWGRESVCATCLSQFAKPRLRCHTCALPLPTSSGLSERPRCGTCLSIGSALDAVYAAVDYAYPWDRLLQRLKYSDRGDLQAQPALAHSMARVMRAVAQTHAPLQQALQEAERADWIVAVPLHPQRQQQRGFNQSQQLARALFPQHSRIRSDLLMRIKDTATQADLQRDERIGNLRNAFAADPLHAHLLKGRRVMLIDDVTTTGSTLNAAAQALQQAGATQVQAIVFARTS